MGSVEEQMLDEPFANDLIGLSDYVLDAGDMELNVEIAAIGESSPAERIELTQAKDSPWEFVEVLGWTDMPEETTR